MPVPDIAYVDDDDEIDDTEADGGQLLAHQRELGTSGLSMEQVHFLITVANHDAWARYKRDKRVERAQMVELCTSMDSTEKEIGYAIGRIYEIDAQIQLFKEWENAEYESTINELVLGTRSRTRETS